MPALLFAAAGLAPAQAAPALGYRVVAEYPHDVSAFTEGLAFDGQGRLIESTGRYAHSSLIVRDLPSGRALQRVDLNASEFGEGTTVVGGRIVQLTWLNQVGHVYDLKLKPLASFTLDDEGWGLTYDGRRLIQSDGTADLHFLDPASFALTGTLPVRDGGTPIVRLNELEYARGLVYANVWQTDHIAVIAPDSGRVLAWLDLHALRARLHPPPGWQTEDDSLNGIAYDPRSGHFFVTGKCWPTLFELAVDKVVR